MDVCFPKCVSIPILSPRVEVDDIFLCKVKSSSNNSSESSIIINELGLKSTSSSS